MDKSIEVTLEFGNDLYEIICEQALEHKYEKVEDFIMKAIVDGLVDNYKEA